MKNKVMVAVCLSSLLAFGSVSFANHHEGAKSSKKDGHNNMKCKDCDKKKKDCKCKHDEKHDEKKEGAEAEAKHEGAEAEAKH